MSLQFENPMQEKPIPRWTEETLRPLLEKALQELSETEEPQLVAAIMPVIWTNLSRGRIQSFLNGHENPTPDHYVKRVATCYEKFHSQVAALQENHSPEAWQKTQPRLIQAAYHYFQRCDFAASPATWEMAEECASEAAARMLTAHFPYDVDFDPWMFTLLRYVCVAKLKSFFRNPTQDLSELEESLTDSAILTGRKIENIMAMLKDLKDGYEKLSPARQEVIRLYYFEGRSFAEIAEALGKSIGAIHQLHFHALRELEKFIKKNDRN
jgi:RNA polymerase sigma factor (sigma-70 family)